MSTPIAVTRALTRHELTAIIAGIEATCTDEELLEVGVRSVYDALLSDHGLTTDSLRADQLPLDRRRFQIPASQWQAIAAAIVAQASARGTGLQLATYLIDVMPSGYDDPAAWVPDSPPPDRRPDLLQLRLTREAVDVIAAATTHIQALGAGYGPTSPQYARAAGTWATGLRLLLSMDFGAENQVHRDGPLSLLVTTSSDFTFGLVFHGERRHCIGCGAGIADDGTVHPVPGRSLPADHVHQPSYPRDAPQPGEWGTHS